MRAAGCLLVVAASAACQPAAFPRSGEVPPAGEISGEVALTPVAYEPQRVTLDDGRRLRSSAAIFPMVSAGLRGSFGLCEAGGFYAMTRVAAEGRCGVLQPRLGAPIALAVSGAAGVDYGPYFAPFARFGLDASFDLGPIMPMVGLYLSASTQLRYVEDPGDPPNEGPFPGSKSVVRSERRLTLPIGLAIPVARSTTLSGAQRRIALVLGATPWFLLGAGACLKDHCGAPSWDGDRGVVFSIGVDVR